MKRYEYYSALTPDAVRARLLVRARRMTGLMDTYDEHQLLVKFLPDGRFYLWKTGGMWQARPQLPFVGTVVPWERGSLIAGDFAPTTGMQIQICVMAVLAFLTGLAFTKQLFPSLAAALLFSGMCFAMLYWLAPSLLDQQHRETLEFIENHLLA